MTIQSRRCGLERRERQARDKAVSDAKKIQKTAPEHRWGGRTIFAKGCNIREGKAMIHASRRDRKTKAVAEMLAMIANVQVPLAPHRPRPVLEGGRTAIRNRRRILRGFRKICRVRYEN